MRTIIKLLVIAIAFSISAFNTANNWNVKDNYEVKFTSKRVDGVFKGLRTNIVFDENNLNLSTINATIDANTVNTGNGLRNKHAKQGLGAEEFAIIKFESSSIIKKGNGYEAMGKLSIRDVTKDIVLPFTFTRNGTDGIFAGSFSLKTKDYHVEKMGTPEEITVHLNVPVKQ